MKKIYILCIKKLILMTIGTQNNKSYAVKLKPPGAPTPNGFRYIPEGYHVCKNIVSSPGAACKRYFRWLLFLYPKRRMMQ